MLRRWGIVLALISTLVAMALHDDAAQARQSVAMQQKLTNQQKLTTQQQVAMQQPIATQQQVAMQDQEAGARAAEQSGGRDFSIGGTVVDSATGKPVGHALVGLEIEGTSTMRRVMTGEDGRFEITGIAKAGPGRMEAWKPGYFSPRNVRLDRYRGRGGMQAITVEPGADVTIRLTPEATIAGQVVDESGEPIEGLPMELVFEAAEQGKRVLREQDRVVTNEEGRFRFANLRSGRYFVEAGPSEEEASRSSEKGRVALGYPAEFYGGGNDYSTASPVDLTAGKHVDLDMRLALEPLFHVTGSITGNPRSVRSDVRILNAARQRVGQTYLQKSDGEFQIALLPRGSYTIRSAVFGGENNQCAVAVKHLDLTRDELGLRLMMTPCVTIPVNVHVERTSEEKKKDAQSVTIGADGVARDQSSAAQVVLFSKDDPSPFSRLRSLADKNDDLNAQSVRNVEPGAYRAEVYPRGALYVESVQSGLTDLEREDLVVAEGAAVAPIEVRLRDDGAGLEGSIKGGDAGGAKVAIAIPEKSERLSKIAVAQDGKYRFQNLAPGAYRIVAVDRVDDFAYAERDVMAKYLAQSKEVNLRANGKETVDLELVHVGPGEQQ